MREFLQAAHPLCLVFVRLLTRFQACTCSERCSIATGGKMLRWINAMALALAEISAILAAKRRACLLGLLCWVERGDRIWNTYLWRPRNTSEHFCHRPITAVFWP